MNELEKFDYGIAIMAVLLSLAAICLPTISEAQKEAEVLAGTPEAAHEIVDKVTGVIRSLASESGKGLPSEVFGQAAAVVIMPNLAEAGFIPGGRHGAGLLMVNENDQWSPPIFVSTTGGNPGAQIGIPSMDLIFVFTSRDTIQRLQEGGRLALGIDASMEAGPAGQIDDEALRDTEILAYARSEDGGRLEGISIAGSTLALDRDTTLAFYEEGIRDTGERAFYGKEQRLTEDLLSIEKRARIEIPSAGKDLQEVLKIFASGPKKE